MSTLMPLSANAPKMKIAAKTHVKATGLFTAKLGIFIPSRPLS
jgi:hypothetical protein